MSESMSENIARIHCSWWFEVSVKHKIYSNLSHLLKLDQPMAHEP